MADQKLDFIEGTKELIQDAPILIVCLGVVAFVGHAMGWW